MANNGIGFLSGMNGNGSGGGYGNSGGSYGNTGVSGYGGMNRNGFGSNGFNGGYGYNAMPYGFTNPVMMGGNQQPQQNQNGGEMQQMMQMLQSMNARIGNIEQMAGGGGQMMSDIDERVAKLPNGRELLREKYDAAAELLIQYALQNPQTAPGMQQMLHNWRQKAMKQIEGKR